MDKIELRVESCSGKPLENSWSAVFGLAGGTIGRGGQNKLILPDTDAAIARVHAMVRLGGDGAYLANLCERRLVEVDNEVVRPGQEVQMPLGARITIGPYSIGVHPLNTVSATAAVASKRATQTPFPPSAQTPVHSSFSEASVDSPPAQALVIPEDFNPFEVATRPVPKDEWTGLNEQSLTELAQHSHDGLIKALPLSGVLDDQLDNPAHSGLPKRLDPTPQLDPLALFSQSSFVAQAETPEGQTGRTSELAHVFHLPRANDTGTLPASAPAGFAQPPDTSPQVSEESLLAVQSAGLQSVQGLNLSLFGREKVSSFQPGDLAKPVSLRSNDQLASPSPGVPSTPPIQTDQRAEARSIDVPLTSRGTPLQAFGLTLSGDDSPGGGASSPVSLEGSSTEIVKPASDELNPQAHTLLSPKSEPPEQGDIRALASAFLEGAGLTADRAKLSLTPEFMRAFGEAFRVAIEGSIDLLAARSEIKQEFRAGVTVIGSSANNPLKFLPNADGVIMQLVGQQFPGFMQPVPAIREAYDDLRVHQIALMAGIRAAYSEALKRFDPERMEQDAPKAGFLANLYDGSRKAELWEKYKKNFNKLKDSAEDDLTAFSGQTFVQAYETAAAAAKGRA